jgi:chromosome partitioning protein
MRTIAFVGQKGGSGKSTIALSLAVAAHEMNEKVSLIDMDPQGLLANWAKIRANGDIDVIASGAAPLPALLASLERKAVTLAIVDTPGAEGAASSAAMQAADLNIVPSRLNASGARGDRRRVRLPTQSVPARPANCPRPGRR